MNDGFMRYVLGSIALATLEWYTQETLSVMFPTAPHELPKPRRMGRAELIARFSRANVPRLVELEYAKELTGLTREQSEEYAALVFAFDEWRCWRTQLPPIPPWVREAAANPA